VVDPATRCTALGVLGELQSTLWPENYSRSRIVAGPDGLVLATRERGLQVQPASIHNAGEKTV